MIKQARLTRNASKGMKALAKIDTKKSETGCHRVFRQYGQAADVRISYVDLPSKSRFPYVRFSDWLEFIVTNDDLDCLVGVKDLKLMRKALDVFWRRYQGIQPNHVIFDMASRGELDPSMTVPVLWHGDEGRGLKKKQILILSTHGCLGQGTTKSQHLQREDADDESCPLLLNMKGHTLKTHFIQSATPVSLYNNSPQSFNMLLQIQADEFTSLLKEGIEVEGRRFWVACLGCKGDAPWLTKAGGFDRSYARRPTAKESKKACAGICHRCLAGKEDWHFPVPFEEIGTLQPAWLRTVGIAPAYSVPAPFLRIPFDKEGRNDDFFRYDLFHNWHMGVGKAFISSAVCIIMEVIPETIVKTFDLLTVDFLGYCKAHKESPYHHKLSPTLFGVHQGFQDCPDGGWSKGDFTRLLHKWFGDYCSRNIVGKQDDPLCLKCVRWLHIETETF